MVDAPAEITEAGYARLEAVLTNSSGKVPLAHRFRALFELKGIATHEAIDIIGKAFDESALLGHELAYVLGQIKDPYALPILNSVLENESEHPMVRHEAAEALGAISSPRSLPVLQKYAQDPDTSVRETCEIALAKIEWDHDPANACLRDANPYSTVDPAPAITQGIASLHDTPESALTPKQLRVQLLDESLSLFVRYRAMFALRNIGDRESVLALADGFSDSSALFRHEIAYIFGQLSSPDSVPSLVKVLQNEQESDMVRHEAAEALGSIANEDVLSVLKEWSTKGPRVVRESCLVALDMYEYENSGELHYAAAPIAV
ncbi:uncharacterized protein L969DRAFT_90977 [Mixia osmundae IAM 14324]|uniref:Deoxyhypusine hydroxylase n=1 Tax=Mixia osmundae (strain CBS 9802 / IAM 14324 / JCM 22182 / KY 12970) TaxID=764103 RepID=G7DV44_MIXOS|nr:uncharacterized protein L969DRAFT_90977 [Mixia osmundae IAM 14324]KEI36329.1 hypothetical protein L969DRAFT_90977 [Mixia osmundae IAM 14324]GAA94454.1 hypothetical protein E5Q_01106 [Mixia osmundae IAM 14324]